MEKKAIYRTQQFIDLDGQVYEVQLTATDFCRIARVGERNPLLPETFDTTPDKVRRLLTFNRWKVHK